MEVIYWLLTAWIINEFEKKIKKKKNGGCFNLTDKFVDGDIQCNRRVLAETSDFFRVNVAEDAYLNIGNYS